MKFEIKINTDLLKNEIEKKQIAILEAIGIQAEANAKTNITDAGRIDTGRLRNSITHTVSGGTVFVGTPVKYGIWHEVGTGIFADDGQGRKSPWAYQDSKGIWHNTRGVKPSHFLKNAVADHMEEYKKIALEILKM